jgi:membrane protease YdiL (CAAX protease family)
VAETYFLLAVVVLFTVGGFRGLREHLSFRYTSMRDVALALSVWVATLCAIALLLVALAPIVGPLPTTLMKIVKLASDMSRLRSADATSTFFIVARACILVPFVEEILFRGALFAWLRNRLSAASSIVISAVAFAAIHFYPTLMPVAFLLGLGAAWVRERTGSSFNFFVAHVANSILFLAAAYWQAFSS